MKEAKVTMKRVFGLDVLRATAITGVLASHGSLLFSPQPTFLEVFGFLGVEMFFVLSGFLIGGILIKQFENSYTFKDIKNFWIRRWFRTVPNYFLFLLIDILLSIKDNHPFNGINDIWKFFLFLQNFAYVQSNFFTISWSLTVEEWFYLILPVLLFIIYNFTKASKKKSVLMTILVMLITVTAIRCLYVLLANPAWNDGVRRIVVFRLDSMMYGVFAAFLYNYYKSFWDRSCYYLAALGTALLSTSILAYFQLPLNESYYARTFLFSITSLAVFCFLPVLNNWKFSKGFFSTAITSISLWSYSLYLCHPLILGRAMNWNKYFANNLLANLGMLTVYIALSILFSYLCFNYFEKPTTKLRDRLKFH